MPGDAAEKLDRVFTRGSDAVIVDLEDGVAPDAKAAARLSVAAWLATLPPAGDSSVEVWVRVNQWPAGRADVEAVVCRALTGICLAKTLDAPDLVALDATLAAVEVDSSLPVGSMSVQPLVETAGAVLAAERIARAPRVERLQLGEVDLAADIGASPGEDGLELLLARSQVVLASAAAGIGAASGPVQADFRDADGFARTTAALKRLGFGSRACIHPCQVEAANEMFSPTPAEIERARRILQSFQEVIAQGPGVFARGGRMIDKAVVRSARQTVARAESASRAVSDERR